MTNNSDLIVKLHTSQILVGLDLGEKTIGIAVSDKSLIVATPLQTISRKGIKKDLIKLSEILKEYNIGGFVMGLPISLDGTENQQTSKVIKMGDEIKNYFVVPIDYFDERFSSDVIFKEMRKANLSRSKIKNKIDQQAAAYILQGYLEKNRNK
jgi:putative Holliday junction resolvase